MPQAVFKQKKRTQTKASKKGYNKPKKMRKGGNY